MDDQLNREDLAVLIRGRQISRQIGLASDADIKTICEHAGISRKTGYQWAGKYGSGGKEQQLEQEIAELKADNEKLIKELDEVRFENEGRKLAWEIHNADELLKEKKSNTIRSKSKKR